MHKKVWPLLRVGFALAAPASAAGCGVPRAANGEGGDATKSDRLDQLLAAVDAKSDETVFKKLLFAPRRDIVLPKAPCTRCCFVMRPNVQTWSMVLRLATSD